MFDFFRKDKGTAKPVVPDASPDTPAPQTSKPALDASASEPVDSGMRVEDSGLGLAAEVEEAVVLYASGHTGEATTALHRFIQARPEARDPEPWRLLFDIYEVTGQQGAFEDLAVDYALRFERSPPTWRGATGAGPAQGAADAPAFAFGAQFSAQDRSNLERFLRACGDADTVALDFNTMPVPDDDAYGRAVLDCLVRLGDAGKRVQLSGADAFIVRLDASRAGARLSEPLWLLLLQLLQLQGRAQEFETVALEYAVRFEISPPSYVAPACLTREGAGVAAHGPGGSVFPLHGAIGPAEASVFADLRAYAMSLPRVEIDLSQVSRIDFMVVGLLMDTVMSLAQAGHRVVFKEGNEMVSLLLGMVGLGQLATIQPKVRT